MDGRSMGNAISFAHARDGGNLKREISWESNMHAKTHVLPIMLGTFENVYLIYKLFERLGADD